MNTKRDTYTTAAYNLRNGHTLVINNNEFTIERVRIDGNYTTIVFSSGLTRVARSTETFTVIFQH